MTWLSKPLRYGGDCSQCGKKISPRETGWHNPDAKKVRCVQCGPLAEAAEVEVVAEEPRAMGPIGGTAALREARRRKSDDWMKGAAGEYLLDQSLHKRLTSESVILADRRIPGTRGNVDIVVVARSGVWIIDSKTWRGKIEYKATTMLGTDYRLFVDGKDRTTSVEAIYGQVIPVAEVIGDRSVPINAALVFIEGDWSVSLMARLVASRPLRHLGVTITAPLLLSKLINEPGELETNDIERLGRLLDSALVAMP